MKIDYGDTYSDKYYAQLFYSETEDDMNENDSFKSFFNNNTIELKSNLSVCEYQKYLLRLDPTNSKENFSIKRVKIVYRRNELISINGKQLADYISGARNFDIEVSGNDLKVSSNTGDTTLDLYPTTLDALGVQIEGNRLGLGTNLYSGEKTLAEKFGLDYLNVELLKDSKLYRKKLLYGNK